MVVDVAVAPVTLRPVQVPQAGEGVTVYWVMAEPPMRVRPADGHRVVGVADGDTGVGA